MSLLIEGMEMPKNRFGKFLLIYPDGTVFCKENESYKAISADDIVSAGAYDQTDWERCVALTQLKEIGKSLGERMDDVRLVVFCKDCKYWGLSEIEPSFHVCKYLYGAEVVRNEDDFCSRGKRKEES